MNEPVTKFEHWGALPVHSRRAMVATADEHATAAAISVLREGGNVIDAAVTAAFALCVTQPGMCGLGGGGHLLARFADGRMLCLDFREQAPELASRDMFARLAPDASVLGWLAAATPGTVKGLAKAHRQAGSLRWPRLLEPAIELAEEGHAVSYLRSRMLATSTALDRDPESHRILLRDGRGFEAGETLRQPELAATLRRIALNGDDELYQGETAELLARAVAAHGGAIRKSDLESYTCAERTPLRRPYRARDVYTMPPSSAGGIGLLQMLAMLEGTPSRKTVRCRPASCISWRKRRGAASPSGPRRSAIPPSPRLPNICWMRRTLRACEPRSSRTGRLPVRRWPRAPRSPSPAAPRTFRFWIAMGTRWPSHLP